MKLVEKIINWCNVKQSGLKIPADALHENILKGGEMIAMNNTRRLFGRSFVFVLFLVLCSVVPAFAVQTPIISWTDWTSATVGSPGSASGTIILPSGTIGVTYTGEVVFAQTGSGTNYWTEPNPSSLPYTGPNGVPNAPPASELIALQLSNITNTLTFTSPLVDPVMAFVSIGRLDPAYTTSYTFNTASFTLLSEGEGYWGDGYWSKSGSTLTGNEAHGVIQFNGTFSSISWTNTPNEYWHGITVGAPVPIPGAVWLFGSGLLGLVGIGRKRLRK